MREASLRHPVGAIAVLTAFGMLVACGAATTREPEAPVPAPEAIAVVVYTCADARWIEARYDNSQSGASSLRLEVDGRSFEMQSVATGSGARFATENGLKPGYGLQWWTRGEEATLSEILMDHTTSGPVALTTCTSMPNG